MLLEPQVSKARQDHREVRVLLAHLVCQVTLEPSVQLEEPDQKVRQDLLDHKDHLAQEAWPEEQEQLVHLVVAVRLD